MTPAVAHKKAKYMVIDISTVEATHIVHVCHHEEAQLWGQILKAQGKSVIAPPLLARGFSTLDRLPMQYLSWNLTKEAPSEDYSENLKKCMAVVEAYPMDDTPIEELRRTAHRFVENSGPKAEPDPHAAPRKQGGTTTRVWELADLCLANRGGIAEALDWKLLRADIVAACRADEINDGTTGVQYSKWKAAKLAKK